MLFLDFNDFHSDRRQDRFHNVMQRNLLLDGVFKFLANVQEFQALVQLQEPNPVATLFRWNLVCLERIKSIFIELETLLI